MNTPKVCTGEPRCEHCEDLDGWLVCDACEAYTCSDCAREQGDETTCPDCHPSPRTVRPSGLTR